MTYKSVANENIIRDGWYLFVYSDIDPVLNILKSSLRHDHNMALFKKKGENIRLVHHWEFERITGIKHHNVSFFNRDEAINFINKQLSIYDLCIEDMEAVIGTPEIDSESNYHSLDKYNTVTYHSVSHAFSSMLVKSEDFYGANILALAFDGGSDNVIDKKADEKSNFCGIVSHKGNINVFPIPSPGIYWTLVSDRFVMPEGSLMALAYATNAKSLESFDELPDYYGPKDRFSCKKAIDDLIDRVFSYKCTDEGKLFTGYDNRFSDYDNKISMVMKVIQEKSVSKTDSIINNIVKKYNLLVPETIISLSGGYALNCPTNTHIMHKFGFLKQACCPCVNDSGLSIGMGLFYFYKRMQIFKYEFPGAAIGKTNEVSLAEIDRNFNEFIGSIQYNTDKIVEDILKNPIVWFYNSSESGPRALGYRSLLANPIAIESKDKLNLYKQRQWWRPVAPIVLEEEIDKWFEKPFSSPFMLNNFKIKDDKKDRVPAVIHHDGTARVQTVNITDNEKLYEIVKEFKDATGVPILCNTSLNDKGEPIIESVEQALNFALRKNINVVYVNGIRIELKEHKKYDCQTPLERDNRFFIQHKNQSNVIKELNPYDLKDDELLIYKHTPALAKYNIKEKNDVEKLLRIINKIKIMFKDDVLWLTRTI